MVYIKKKNLRKIMMHKNLVEQDKPICEKNIQILQMTIFFVCFGGRIKNHLLCEKITS